jgi:hypothetical protein
MLFTLFILLLVALVVYFHYLQGFFSAALSAVIAVISAMVAIGYHENLVYSILGGKYAAQAHAIALVVLFAISYIVLRQIFDRFVPGNVRFPVLVDKIGSAVMGLVAGVFAVGIVVLAAHTLPFGPSIMGYSRFPMNFDASAHLHLGGNTVTANFDQLDTERFLENQPEKLLVPVDDLVVSFAEHVTSPGGPLASGTPLTEVHPDYLQELFAQRIGLQPAASRVAQIEKSMSIAGVYAAKSFPQDDQERWLMLGRMATGVRGPEAAPTPPPLEPVLKAPEGKQLLVVRVQLDVGAAERKNNLVAFGPANVRLVASGKNYFPIGTLENGRTLLRNAPDDYLFVPATKGADLVFLVDEADVLVPGEGKTFQTKPGAFLEFKRLPKEYLPETVTMGVPPPGDRVLVVRKEGMRGARAGTATAQGGGDGGAGAGAAAATLAFQGLPEASVILPMAIGVGAEVGNSGKGEQDWGTFTLTEGRFSRLEINPVRTIEIISQRTPSIDVLYHSRKEGIIQWTAVPQGSTKWEWASDLANYELVDGNNKPYQPYGFLAKVVSSNGGTMLLARYDAAKPVTSVSSSNEVKPTEVTLFWVVPTGTQIRTLNYKKEGVQSISITP